MCLLHIAGRKKGRKKGRTEGQLYLRRQYRRLAAKAGQEKEEMEYRRRCMCRWEKEEEIGEGEDEKSWAGPMCVSTYIVLTGHKEKERREGQASREDDSTTNKHTHTHTHTRKQTDTPSLPTTHCSYLRERLPGVGGVFPSSACMLAAALRVE